MPKKIPYKPLNVNKSDNVNVKPIIKDLRSIDKKKTDLEDYKKSQRLGEGLRDIAAQTALEEAYNKLPLKQTQAWAKDPNKNHLPDTYKLPNHPTFSNESKYYKEGMKAVKWEGDKAIPINQEPEFKPDIVSTVTPQAKTKFYQGYDFMQQTGLKNGDYSEEQIQNAMKSKGTKQLSNKYSNGTRSLRKYTDGTPFSETGLGTGLGIATSVVPMVTSLLPKDHYTDNKGNDMGTSNSIGGDVLDGAAMGAQIDIATGGATMGLGTAAGALYGLGKNYFGNEDMKKNVTAANIRNNNIDLNTRTMSNIGQTTKQTYNNNNMIYADGGMINVNEDMENPTEEVEGLESATTPNGDHIAFNGPSHEEGGIETNLPEGTFIFTKKTPRQLWVDIAGSKRIPREVMELPNKSISGMAKPIQNNIEKLKAGEQNARSKNTLQLEEQKLKYISELQESSKGNAEQFKQSNVSRKNEGFANGGWKYADGGLKDRIKYRPSEGDETALPDSFIDPKLLSLRNAQDSYEQNKYLSTLPNSGSNLKQATEDYNNIGKQDRIDDINNSSSKWNNFGKGELGSLATSTATALAQYNNKPNAPRKLSRVNITPQGNPKYMDLSAQRNDVNNVFMGARDEANRSFSNSAAKMAFNTKARLAQLDKTGEIYQNQENLNTDIYNKNLAMNNELNAKNQELNNNVERYNIDSDYDYRSAIKGLENNVYSSLGHNVGKVFDNQTAHQNRLDELGIYSKGFTGDVNKKIDPNGNLIIDPKPKANGGYTFANGGKTYHNALQEKAIGKNVKTIDNATTMDNEYSNALAAGKDTYHSSVTDLDYKVIRSLPKGEKRLMAANMWKDTHGTAPTKSQEKATIKAIEGKKVSSPGAKEVVNNMPNFNTQKPDWITPEMEDLNTYKQQQDSDDIKEQKTIANLKKWNPNAASYYEKTGDLQGALDNYVAPDRFDASSGSAGYSIGKAVKEGNMEGVDYLNAGMLLAGAFGARKGKVPSNNRRLNEKNPRLSNTRSTPEERTIQGTKNWKYKTEQTPGLQEYYDKKAKMFTEVNPNVRYQDPTKPQGKIETKTQKLLPGSTKTYIDSEDEQFALDFNKRENARDNAKLDRKLKIAEGADHYPKAALKRMNKHLDDMEIPSGGKLKEEAKTLKNLQKFETANIKLLEKQMKAAKLNGGIKKYNNLNKKYLNIMENND